MNRWAKRTKPDGYVRCHIVVARHRAGDAAYKSFFAKTRKVQLSKAAGEIIAEVISPFPPGFRASCW
jgi:arginine/lysine/ornithine decarboxylase